MLKGTFSVWGVQTYWVEDSVSFSGDKHRIKNMNLFDKELLNKASFKWQELDGKTLRIKSFLDEESQKVWTCGSTDDGVVYFIAFEDVEDTK